jgi:ubiquinol-cytochrome c reductase cytochrome c1 subunit
MTSIKTLALTAAATLGLSVSPLLAAEAFEPETTDVAFSFEGPFGKFDEHQLQRGLQVYTEVCSACHGLKYVPIRTLSDEGGPKLPEDQVRVYAEQWTVIDKETGEERGAVPADNFPHSAMETAPDLSLMAKKRAGFHGPYGTGINQFLKGIGGPEHMYSILTGYSGEEKEEAGVVYYENHAFSTGWISMPPPLSDDLVTYADGTAATTAQMAEDVSAFMMWAAEPHMMARKQTGFVAVLFLGLLAALLYLTNKRIWAGVKGRKHA